MSALHSGTVMSGLIRCAGRSSTATCLIACHASGIDLPCCLSRRWRPTTTRGPTTALPGWHNLSSSSLSRSVHLWCLCCAVLCCAVLCCAVLCCAVLCLPVHAELCGAVLCKSVLNSVAHDGSSETSRLQDSLADFHRRKKRDRG